MDNLSLAFRQLYGISLIAIALHSVLFLLRVKSTFSNLFTWLFLPTTFLTFACLTYAYRSIKSDNFRLGSQLWILLPLFALVDISISLYNISIVGPLTLGAFVLFLGILPDFALMFLGAALWVRERSGDDKFLKLLFKSFLIAVIVGRPALTVVLYTPDIIGLLSANTIGQFMENLADSVTLVLTFSLLIPIYVFVLARMSRDYEHRRRYFGLAGSSYALTIFVPRIFSTVSRILSYDGTLVGTIAIVERFALFVQGAFLLALFVKIRSELWITALPKPVETLVVKG